MKLEQYCGDYFKLLTFGFIFTGFWGVALGTASHLGYGPLEQPDGLGFGGLFGAIFLGMGFGFLRARRDAFKMLRANQ